MTKFKAGRHEQRYLLSTDPFFPLMMYGKSGYLPPSVAPQVVGGSAGVSKLCCGRAIVSHG